MYTYTHFYYFYKFVTIIKFKKNTEDTTNVKIHKMFIIVYYKVLIPRNLLCSEKLLVVPMVT